MFPALNSQAALFISPNWGNRGEGGRPGGEGILYSSDALFVRREQLLKRVRHFTDGVIFGSREFINEMV